MLLTEAQLKSYEEAGFLYVPNCFSNSEANAMNAELPRLFAEDNSARILEKGGAIVRSVYGSHFTNDLFSRLSRHPKILEPVKQILGSDVYVYQFKINAKAAFGGDIWEWHQDYIYWLKEDGMPAARVVNIVVFLDEVTEFNGPMLMIPRSHKEGVIEVESINELAVGVGEHHLQYRNSPAWISSLTAKLKYSVSKQIVSRLASENGIASAKGPAGSVLLFHPNLVHGSSPNMSPYDRNIVVITYNSVENVPPASSNPRPEFLVSSNCSPIIAIDDELL